MCRELEASLEAMREEYERCEEYWAGKLADERAAHERELRGGDERLAELVARVADYERHFAPQLPPIEERAALEAQVTQGPAQTLLFFGRKPTDFTDLYHNSSPLPVGLGFSLRFRSLGHIYNQQ